jgi:hypothetical protein
MPAVVPSFLRHPDSASASQAPDVSILSHLAPSSRVDLPDNHILDPPASRPLASLSAVVQSEYTEMKTEGSLLAQSR